jgi:predicted deacylase
VKVGCPRTQSEYEQLVLPGEPARRASDTVVIGYRIVTNARGGFRDVAVKPGDRVRAGSVLGRIFDVYRDVVETMTAPAGSDIVLGVSTYPATATGGWLFELGTGLREVPAAGTTEKAPKN